MTIAGLAERHADPRREQQVACHIRRARTAAFADAAVTPADLFAALRDHGPGGLRWSPLDGSLIGPCAHAGGRVTATQTTSSWVADLRNGGLHWATAAPCTSVFHPVRFDEPVDLGSGPTNRFDPSVRWWPHEVLHRSVMCDHSSALTLFVPERDRLERAWLDDPPESATAFGASAEAEALWTDRVAAADLTDRRPDWLRERWQTYDASAALDVQARRSHRLKGSARDPVGTGRLARSIHAWSVGVWGLPWCWAIATSAMNALVSCEVIWGPLSDTSGRIACIGFPPGAQSTRVP